MYRYRCVFSTSEGEVLEALFAVLVGALTIEMRS